MDTIYSTVIAVPLLLTVWPFMIPIAAAFYMFWLGWTKGGDPEQDSATVQYEPPENLTPAECGALLDNAVALRCIAATIVDLSVRGYLAIEPNADSKLPGHPDNQDCVFHMTKLPGDWINLKPHERSVLSAIFLPTNPLRLLMESLSRLRNVAGNTTLSSSLDRVRAVVTENPALRALSEAGNLNQRTGRTPSVLEVYEPRPVVALSEAQNHFYLHRTAIGNCIFDALVAGGYYTKRPDMVRLFYVASGILIGLLMVPLGRTLAAMGTPLQSWILSAILTSMIISGFGWFMPGRSMSGARALAKVRGFASFLARVEKDHIDRMEKSPELFEKYLPYAMALRVENKWAQAFASIAVRPPNWYRGRGGNFFSADLVKDLSAMSKQTGNPMAMGGAPLT
jgi:predicted membrane protein DUF2207